MKPVIWAIVAAGLIWWALMPSRVPPAVPRVEPYVAPTADQIAVAQTQIAERLKDPASAQFRGSYVSRKASAVCGEVNARNGFGGYGGYKRFIVQGQAAFTSEDFGIDGITDEIWSRYCQK